MNFASGAQMLSGQLTAWRRHFHKNPELSLQEWQTTEAIHRELAAMGIPVTRYDDHTGLIASVTGSRPGKTVLLRADIDALPIRENTGLPFASDNGAMHACGHDCHIAMLLGAAKLLQDNRDALCGTARLLFQAAEETSHGAEYFIEQGCLEGVDGVFGIHVWSELDAPLISVESGPRMSGCDNFEVIIRGTAAHGAQPHKGCDAILAAAQGITMLQGYTARRHSPFDPLVITVGTVHGGQAFNIVADTVTLTGTARCFSSALRSTLEEDIRRVFHSAAAPYGCTAELVWHRLTSPVSNDDTHLNATAQRAAEVLYGAEGLGRLPALTVSEDFAYYGDRVPSFLAFVGGRNPEVGAVYPHHNECFRIDEAALPRGAALYAQFALEFLKGDE